MVMKSIKKGKYPDTKLIVRVVLTAIILGLGIWIWSSDLKLFSKIFVSLVSVSVLYTIFKD
jgi:hypothetical protein